MRTSSSFPSLTALGTDLGGDEGMSSMMRVDGEEGERERERETGSSRVQQGLVEQPTPWRPPGGTNLPPPPASTANASALHLTLPMETWADLSTGARVRFARERGSWAVLECRDPSAWLPGGVLASLVGATVPGVHIRPADGRVAITKETAKEASTLLHTWYSELRAGGHLSRKRKGRGDEEEAGGSSGILGRSETPPTASALTTDTSPLDLLVAGGTPLHLVGLPYGPARLLHAAQVSSVAESLEAVQLGPAFAKVAEAAPRSPSRRRVNEASLERSFVDLRQLIHTASTEGVGILIVPTLLDEALV